MHFKYRSHYHSTSLPRHRSAVVLTIHTRHRSEGANILIAENISCITIQWANENITNVGILITAENTYRVLDPLAMLLLHDKQIEVTKLETTPSLEYLSKFHLSIIVLVYCMIIVC